MINKKCPICTKVKGKRGCLKKDNHLICSKCCAEIRDQDCENCSYYKEAQQFNIEKAKKSPQHFVARIDPDVDDKIDQALQQLEFGNVARCEQMLNALYEENSDLYTMHFALGTLYGVKDDYDRAIESFDKSLAIYPYNAECWFNRMTAAQKKLDIPELVFSARKVIELGEPSDNIVFNAKDLLNTVAEGAKEENGLSLDAYVANTQTFNEGFDLMEKQQWQKAIEKFEQVVAKSSRNAPPFGNLGICYMQLGDTETALKMFDRAIEIDPEYEPAHLNKALLEVRMENGSFSFEDMEMKPIKYSAEYNVKENRSLIKDYFSRFFKSE
jgi:tetratricopeptide (TPR) repeat protein